MRRGGTFRSRRHLVIVHRMRQVKRRTVDGWAAGSECALDAPGDAAEFRRAMLTFDRFRPLLFGRSAPNNTR